MPYISLTWSQFSMDNHHACFSERNEGDILR